MMDYLYDAIVAQISLSKTKDKRTCTDIKYIKSKNKKIIIFKKF